MVYLQIINNSAFTAQTWMYNFNKCPPNKNIDHSEDKV